MAFLSSDTELGTLKTSWTNSYNGQKCFFVDHQHVIYKCGSIVKIHNIETGKSSDFIPSYLTNYPNTSENYGNSISILTANSAINKFAYSETNYPPKIHVHNFDTKFSEQSVLLDGATLEYLSIEFSNSHAILGFSGVPDLQIYVWLWDTGVKIASIDASNFSSLQSVQFSPINWRHFAVASNKQLSIWTLDQCGKLTKTQKKRILMPAVNPDYSNESIMVRDEFKYPKHVVSSLEEEYTDYIEEVLDKRERHKLTCLCWTNNNEVVFATDANFIFLYSLTNATMKCVYEPLNDLNDKSYEFSSKKSIKSMVVHRFGIFMACDDGKVRFGVLMKDHTVRLDIQAFDQIGIVKLFEMSSSFIANLSPNTTYSALSIATNKGIYLLNCNGIFKKDEKFNKETIFASALTEPVNETTSPNLYPVLSFDFGVSIGIGSLNPFSDHFVILKDNGCLQIWSNKIGAIVNRFHLDINCTCLATHSFVQMIAIGTESGRIIIVDLSEVEKPRIVLNSKLHNKAVKLIKFNSSDTMLITVGGDNKLFVIDTRLSVESVQQTLLSLDQRLVTSFNDRSKKDIKFETGFYVLGFTEFEGDAVCLDVFDSIVDNIINTRVALGLFDKNNWDMIKKTVYDDTQTVQEFKSIQSSSNNSGLINANMNHNMLVQSVQTKPIVSRYMCVQNVEHINFDINSTEKTANLACKVLVFDLNTRLFAEKEKLYNSKKLDFKDDLISKCSYYTQFLFSDLALSSRNYLVTFTDRFLIKQTIPESDSNKKPSAKFNYLELADVIGSHDFGYGNLTRTLNNQFLVSCGFDGSIMVRKTTDLKIFTETKGNHFKTGGIREARFQFDLSKILVLAQDNTLFNLDWNCSNPEITRLKNLSKIESEFDPSQVSKLKIQAEICELKDRTEEQSWFEMKEKQFFKDQEDHFMPVIKEITSSLKDIKEKLHHLMKVNLQREDIARLKESEFYLDLEELDRLNKESDSEIIKIREKEERENLKKIYVREVIKRECWDQMKTKCQGIQAFNTNLLVENYSLRDRSREELAELEKCKFVRRIEIASQKSRPDFLIDQSKKDTFIISLVENEEDENKDKDQDVGTKDNANQNFTTPNLLHLASKGSIGSMFNGDSNLFYSQFELYTREQKKIQITLIQDAIFRIKENFNREFEHVYQRKLQEIGKVREKNQRLRQIFVDLNEHKALSEPELGDLENAELLFDVKDSEIKIEKYLSPEQRKQLEEQLAEEERRRELEKLDNWRERGLMDMMGGVLQIRREDELKKDVPIPSFVKEKAQEEWTSEEVKQYQVYEQKVKDLNEEREKLRKQLLSEINKLNEQIIECFSNFDTILLGLHHRKIKTQQAIYQEELKIVRIVNSLIVDSEFSYYEKQMIKKLEKCKQQKKELSQEIQQIKKEIEIFKEDFERSAASVEEKPLDKQFSREFSDISSGLRDQLLKILKRRNKQRFYINKCNLNPTHTYLPELGELNPFSERPSTAQQIIISEVDLQTSLNDLDSFSNAPAGIDQTIWDRFVHFRRQKIALESNIRMKGLTLGEMQAFLQNRIEEESFRKMETDELTDQTIKLQQLRLQVFHNLEVQYLIKQGQVEINPGAGVHNFEKCLLINRNVVESLNKIIQSHGKQKITIMVNCKNFKKGIRQLDWERKKMSMTIEDFIQKQRDITYLKLSREIQEYLNTEDYEGKKQKEISILEQTLTYQLKQHQNVYIQRGKRLKEIEHKAVKIANSNDNLDDQLDDSNVVLQDRKHLKEEQTGKTIRIIRDERFREIVQRRRLVDLAKAQAQEVAFLRSEVERLRMKTFRPWFKLNSSKT